MIHIKTCIVTPFTISLLATQRCMAQSWIFSIFSSPVDERLRECRRSVESNRRKLYLRQRREQLNAQQAEQRMRQAERSSNVDQAREYAQQILQAKAAEVQVIQTIGRLQELERSLSTSENIVQLEQVMTDMTQALAQLNNVTPPQRMQHYMMHMERQHQQLEMKRDMMYETTESMRESDSVSAAGDMGDVDALRQARDAVDSPLTSLSSASSSPSGMMGGVAGGSSASTDTALQELERLSRMAAADQSAHEHAASLDPASRLVLEATRQRVTRQAQAALPPAPRSTTLSITASAATHTPHV